MPRCRNTMEADLANPIHMFHKMTEGAQREHYSWTGSRECIKKKCISGIEIYINSMFGYYGIKNRIPVIMAYPITSRAATELNTSQLCAGVQSQCDVALFSY